MEPAVGESEREFKHLSLSFSNCTRASSLPLSSALSLSLPLSLEIDKNTRLVRIIDELLFFF